MYFFLTHEYVRGTMFNLIRVWPLLSFFQAFKQLVLHGTRARHGAYIYIYIYICMFTGSSSKSFQLHFYHLPFKYLKSLKPTTITTSSIT